MAPSRGWAGDADHDGHVDVVAARVHGRAGGRPRDPGVLDDRQGRTGYQYGFYVQDEWRVTDRFTVNFGVRADRIEQIVVARPLVRPPRTAVSVAARWMPIAAG